MKAIVNEKYGAPDVMELKNVETPYPKKDQVLIKVKATSVNAGDWHLLRADPFIIRLMFGFFRPKTKILGMDVAGEIVAVGDNVKDFKVGDEVFGELPEAGAFAEYVCTVTESLIHKPKFLSFYEAAALPVAGVTALQGLRNYGKLIQGEEVLVNGASGGVGLFAVQIAKAMGAKVTAVCSTKKIDVVKEAGADKVVDYKTDNFTTLGKQYDLIIGANGDLSLKDYARALKPQGRYVHSGGEVSQFWEVLFKGGLKSKKGGKSFSNFLCKPNRDDLKILAKMVEEKHIKVQIDKIMSLEEVPDAIRYLESGAAKGKVVISFK